MPGVVTMKQRGTCSKTMAKAKEERVLGALLSQVRVSGKKGRRAMNLQVLGSKPNLALKLRMKLLGEGGEDEAGSCEREQNTEFKKEPKKERATEPNTEPKSESETEPSSVRLAAMVDEFLEDGSSDRKRGRSRSGDASGEEDSKSSFRDELAAILHRNVDNVSEKIVASEVDSAVVASKVVGSELRLEVFCHLRRAGFDAGLCKSRWDQSGGFPGGAYEYIDVTFEDPSGRCERIVIDVDFKGQFEIARPTAHYKALLQSLPSVFVGRVDQIQAIVNIMSEAVKLSLKKRGMHLPPWRKLEYVRAKWLGSYKRKTKLGRSVDGCSDCGSEISDGIHASVVSLPVVAEPQKPEDSSVVKKASIRNWYVPGQAAGMMSNSFDNNDWHLPSLKAKKSPGLRHAGLASLFRKPDAGLREGMAKGADSGA